jgi:hypothetical protein
VIALTPLVHSGLEAIGDARNTGRVNRAAVLALAACGSAADPAPSLDDLEIGCVMLDESLRFTTGADFGTAVAGTLRGWDPGGRWFLTGTRFGDSSLHFQRAGDRVIVNRDPAALARLDDTTLFLRTETAREDDDVFTALRISNLRPDGTARAERARCVNGGCTVCTNQLVLATHNEGEGEGQGLSRVGELAGATWAPGSTLNVRVAGTIAYLIRRDGLHIIETADPANPVELGHYQRFGEAFPNDVKLVEAGARRFALIADSPIDVVEVTRPSAPQIVAQIPEEAHTLFTETRGGVTLAYLGNYDGTCPVYDVTDPTAPRKLGSYDAGASLVHDLSVVDGVAYLNAWEKGLHVVDYNVPSAPRLLSFWPSSPTRTSHSNWTTSAGGRRIALHGDESYNARLDVIDLERGSPTFMMSIGSWQTRPWVSIHNIMAFGTKVYLTYYQDGVRVLDVSQPTRPTQLGYYNTWDPQADYTSSAFFEGAVGLDVDHARKLVFVADSPRGLVILRDETP